MRVRKRVLSERNEGIDKCWLTDTQCVKKKKKALAPQTEKKNMGYLEQRKITLLTRKVKITDKNEVYIRTLSELAWEHRALLARILKWSPSATRYGYLGLLRSCVDGPKRQ